MPRIRTIKPEFWDSPSTAKASPWARLLYIAMWNWADDFGRGTANLKELEGFAFPNDDTFTDCSGNTVHFRDVVAEVSECFGVVLYEVDGRPFYAIPSWDSHQRNERRAKASKFPPPPEKPLVGDDFKNCSGNTVHFRDTVAETPRTSGTGTGEQGNRGTGEQGKESKSYRGGKRLNAREQKPPSPFCENHPHGTNNPCRACGDARRAYETWPTTPTPEPPHPPAKHEHKILNGQCLLCCGDNNHRFNPTGTCNGCNHTWQQLGLQTQPEPHKKTTRKTTNNEPS